ncbi:TetR/AcrR family transcriptional regulator [Streptomyces sp. TP-A0874]|uniref:TetR/AcrR family transcriptional regulator n=1 Tax=Streptomyces sp. TP-A0874 TaxID=549819 RepID=UPI0008533746|nr:TetR/AcrR family transcriptional regulator [Streptomyces sp. TP-A0874]
MPKSPTKRRPATLASLADSALALFTDHGFHATSISDIVQRAGLTRGAFYSNYRDKEEIFLALYDARTDTLLTGLQEAAARLRPGQGPVEQFLEYIAGRTPQERKWFLVSMEFTLHAARNPEVAEALATHEDRLIHGLSEIFGKTLARDGLSPAIAADDLTRLVIAISRGLTAMGLIRGNHAGNHELADRIAPHLLDALTTRVPSDGTPRQGSRPGRDNREDEGTRTP